MAVAKLESIENDPTAREPFEGVFSTKAFATNRSTTITDVRDPSRSHPEEAIPAILAASTTAATSTAETSHFSSQFPRFGPWRPEC